MMMMGMFSHMNMNINPSYSYLSLAAMQQSTNFHNPHRFIDFSATSLPFQVNSGSEGSSSSTLAVAEMDHKVAAESNSSSHNINNEFESNIQAATPPPTPPRPQFIDFLGVGAT